MEARPRVVPFPTSRAREVAGEDRYRQLFENAPIGIINVSLDATPLMVNERCAKTFGYDSPEDFLRNVTSMLDLWVDPEARVRAAEVMLETGFLRDYEVVMKKRDGSHIHIAISANPWHAPDGTVVGLQVSGVEITDRVRAEERLEVAQAQAGIGFFSWHLDTNEFNRTRGISAILGIDYDDGMDQLDLGRVFQLIHPDDRDTVVMKLATIRASATEPIEFEFRVVTPSGEARWLMARAALDAASNLLSGSVQDITSRKQIEERLRELNEMKTEFVGVVAHDLRTPLTVSSGYAELLYERWADLGDDDRREFVDKIRQSLGRLDGLVTDVLEVARLESGTSRFDIRPLDIGDVVRTAAEETCTFETHVGCDVVVDDDVPQVHADHDALMRVLTNLLSNAVKYSPPDARVCVHVSYDSPAVTVSVRDRGPGIQASDQSKLFQKFSRLAPSSSGTHPRGTGLGLFICKSLVEAWGGRVWVESAPGHGSTFGFTVPAATA